MTISFSQPYYAKFSVLSQFISIFRLMFFDQRKVSFDLINTNFSITQKQTLNPIIVQLSSSAKAFKVVHKGFEGEYIGGVNPSLVWPLLSER